MFRDGGGTATSGIRKEIQALIDFKRQRPNSVGLRPTLHLLATT
jgi:hypothetical protein